MSAPERVIVLKSWETRDDVSVIKEVATKGDYVDLCMAYLARKRHIPIDESRKYFHKIVDQYVNRLLNEKLLFKAENVLKNVSRDWKSIYYQYAFDIKLQNQKELILEHIKKKNPDIYQNELEEYEFYWKLLKYIEKLNNTSGSLTSSISTGIGSETTMTLSKLYTELLNELGSINLEALYQKNDDYKKFLILRCYFIVNDHKLLQKIDKTILWRYLINNYCYIEIIKWCYLSEKQKYEIHNLQSSHDDDVMPLSLLSINDLYKKWIVTNDMYEYGIQILQNNTQPLELSLIKSVETVSVSISSPSSYPLSSQSPPTPPPQILKNFFAINGKFFNDDLLNARKLLQTIFTTESFNTNSILIYKMDHNLSLKKYILENNIYSILLNDEFCKNGDFDELLKYSDLLDKRKHISFFIQLKNESLNNIESFLKISKLIYEYLYENKNEININENNLITTSLQLSGLSSSSLSSSLEIMPETVTAETDEIKIKYNQSIIKLFEFLLNDNDINEINNSNEYAMILNYQSYVQSLFKRKLFLKLPNKSINTKCNIYELIKISKHFDLNDIYKEYNNTINYNIQNVNNDYDHIISFSNNKLFNKYSLNIKLNYLHYLKQLRSSYAIYTFFTTQLNNYSQITKTQLHNTTECIIEIAIKNFTKNDFICNCIAFIEMIGFDTQNLRSFIQLLNIVYKSSSSTTTNDNYGLGTISTEAIAKNLIHNDTESIKKIQYNELIENAEKIIFKNYLQTIQIAATSKSILKEQEKIIKFPLRQYNALIKILKLFCNNHKFLPNLYTSHLCGINDWWKFLIIIQYYELSLKQIQSISMQFKSNTLQDHLLRAIIYEPQQDVTNQVISKTKRRSSISRQKSKGKCDNLIMHTSGETVTTSSISSSSDLNPFIKSNSQIKFLHSGNNNTSNDNDNGINNTDLDIFAMILLSSNNTADDDYKIISYIQFLEILFNENNNTITMTPTITEKINNNYSTSINLMRNSIKYNKPVLCILSATINDTNIKYNWLIWLTISINYDLKLLQQANSNYNDIFWDIIESSVRMGYTETLNKSFHIFFKDCKFVYLTNFLHQTHNITFTDNVTDELRSYLLALNNNEINLPLNEINEQNNELNSNNKDYILYKTIKLLLIHLKCNFNSILYQKLYLNIICRSGINDIIFYTDIDFCLIRKLFKIISKCSNNFNQTFNYENLVTYNNTINNNNNNISIKLSKTEIDKLLLDLQNNNEYDNAIELLNILNITIDDIIYTKWLNDIDNSDKNQIIQKLKQYELDTKQYSLSPELLINFYLHIISSYYIKSCNEKYIIMKMSLDVIKLNHLFPNEYFNRDNIEYDMIICYLQNEQNINELNVYYSEYYEQILKYERYVLYKSFEELKELAGIDDITITRERIHLNDKMKMKLSLLLNKLLDDGDIVEALRLQAMFNYWTLDLHFIVFCMGLAEGLTSLYNLSTEERQLLTSVEMTSITKFCKKTLEGSGTGGGPGASFKKPSLTVSQANTSSSSPSNNEQNETLGNWVAFDFEEIPSREKQDILEAIQGLASRLKHGVNIGKRIVMAYRAAMLLDKDYLDVLRMKDTGILLKSATEDDCLQKLIVISDIMTSTQMTPAEIADFLSYEIVTAIIRPRFYILQTNTDRVQTNYTNSHLSIKNNLWGYNLDKEFHLFLELCPNTTLLGNLLLNYCDSLKIYRKYQDNKNFDNDIQDNPCLLNTFENLKEIIKLYGLPNNYQQQQPQQQQNVLYHHHHSMGGSNNGNSNSNNNSNQIYNQSQSHTSQVISHKKQNIFCVELLIKAHECYVHECSMEGIANVLQRSKLLNSILCQSKSWKLIVRMLVGIGRYREMYYCFDTLIKNEQFESLLGQFDDTNYKINGLRHAIMWYIREYCPENKEYLKLAAIHFLLFKELAEIWEQETNSMTAKILSKNQKIDHDLTLSNVTASAAATVITGGAVGGSESITTTSITKIQCSSDTLNQLTEILNNYIHATENYLLDNKLRLAKKSASNAELIALQIDLINKAMSFGTSSGLESTSLSTSSKLSKNCVCILNVRSQDEFKELINRELSVPQAMILSRAYSCDINWPEAILNQYVIMNKKAYILEFMERMELTDSIIENIVKSFQLLKNVKPKMEENILSLIQTIQSISLKYKLASLLGFKSVIMSLINNQSSHYLKDINYGRGMSNDIGIPHG